MISRLLKVTLTEWKLFVTDPAAVLLLVVAGILYAFYYPTAYVNQTVSRVPVAIVDLEFLPMATCSSKRVRPCLAKVFS